MADTNSRRLTVIKREHLPQIEDAKEDTVYFVKAPNNKFDLFITDENNNYFRLMKGFVLPSKGITALESGQGIYTIDANRDTEFRLPDSSGSQQLLILSVINVSAGQTIKIIPTNNCALNGTVDPYIINKAGSYICIDGANCRWTINGYGHSSGGQGPQGEIGPQGPQGTIGVIGPQGPQGDVGGIGPQGDDGQQGTIGPQGRLGPQGEIGPQGPQGSNGTGSSTTQTVIDFDNMSVWEHVHNLGYYPGALVLNSDGNEFGCVVNHSTTKITVTCNVNMSGSIIITERNVI